jgi:hypothetical protein
VSEFISFSVEDIRELRTRESAKMLKMTAEERKAYIKEKSDQFMQEMQEYREERARTGAVKQAKEV